MAPPTDYQNAAPNSQLNSRTQKVNNLLVQNQLLKQKVQTIEENSEGMEDRVKKAVNLEYEARL